MSRYTEREERANVYTHLAGVVFGLLAGVVLILRAIPTEDNWILVSFMVFTVFMTFSFMTSTFYHREKRTDHKLALRKFDHAAIYLHIAGSYTPFTLVLLRHEGAWGWTLFSVVWAAAAIGVLMSFLNLKNASKLETAAYVAMGWVVVVAFKPLIGVLTQLGNMQVLWWLIAGGLAYTLGAVIYLLKKVEFMHAIWHLFVLAGSVCHAVAIFLIVQ